MRGPHIYWKKKKKKSLEKNPGFFTGPQIWEQNTLVKKTGDRIFMNEIQSL
jgi:hypothetical protein